MPSSSIEERGSKLLTKKELEELLTRLGRERRDDAMKVYLMLQMQERRN